MIAESVDSILARQEDNRRAAAGAGANIVDKDGFLRLLIAQMQNQDPLAPLDNSAFLSQMAQFSTLEQLQQINGSLTSSLQWDLLFNQTINNTMATSLIGREVEATGDQVVLGSSGGARVRYALATFAREVTIDIVDASGTVVYSQRLTAQDAGVHDWNWEGKDFSGSRVAPGSYTVRVRAVDSGDRPVAARTYRVGIITGVEYEAGAAFIIVDGQRLALGDIQKISLAGTT